MTIFQTFLTYGYELASIVCCAAALGEPVDRCNPKHVLLSVHYALDVWLQVFVLVHGNCLLERFNVEDIVKAVLPSELGVLSRSHDVLQHLALRILGMVAPAIDTPLAHAGKG